MCDPDCSCDEHNGDTDEEEDDDEEDEWLDPKPCKPPPPPQRRSDPENGPWTGIKKKFPKDPFWKEKKDGRNPRLESSISKDFSNTYTLHDVFLHIL